MLWTLVGILLLIVLTPLALWVILLVVQAVYELVRRPLEYLFGGIVSDFVDVFTAPWRWWSGRRPGHDPLEAVPRNSVAAIVLIVAFVAALLRWC